MNAAGVTLDPKSLDAAFPHRLVIGPDQALAHVGPGLAALVPGAAPGVPLAELCTVASSPRR